MRSAVWPAIGGAVSAVACAVVAAHGATPIDRALPWIAIILAIVAASAEEMNVFCAVPLLIVAEVAIPDEHLRLLTFGAIVAAAFVAAAVRQINLPLVAAGVLLLRWIPLQPISLWRELVILGGVLALFIAMRSRSALALTIALAVALVTPAFPARMVVFPWIVAALALVPNPLFVALLFVCGIFARYSNAPLWFLAAAAMLVPYAARTKVALPAIVAGIAVLIFFPWSGIAARAFPLPISLVALAAVLAVALVGEMASVVAGAAGAAVLVCLPLVCHPERSEGPGWTGGTYALIFGAAHPAGFLATLGMTGSPKPIGIALAANQSYTIELPPNTRSAVVALSGANVSALKSGTVVGRVNDREVRIGDIADFGFMRREHFHASRNTLPRRPVLDFRDYGQSAWIYGAGRIIIDHPPAALRVSAAPTLPAAARLEIESIETR